MIDALKRSIKKLIFHYIKPPTRVIYNSYSQAGEDCVLNFLFETMNIRNPSYIDIGTNQPDACNNTYLFYLRNCSGVCIEPDPYVFKSIVNARPKDICINAAIGFKDDTECDFYIFNEPSLNTLSDEEAQLRSASGKFTIVNKLKVKMIKIEEVIEKYLGKLPDFISLDVEGIDSEILQSFDYKSYPVPIWIVETIDYSENHIKEKNLQLIEFMIQRGYFVYADTFINTIFVNKSWFLNFKDGK